MSFVRIACMLVTIYEVGTFSVWEKKNECIQEGNRLVLQKIEGIDLQKGPQFNMPPSTRNIC